MAEQLVGEDFTLLRTTICWFCGQQTHGEIWRVRIEQFKVDTADHTVARVGHPGITYLCRSCASGNNCSIVRIQEAG